VTAAADAILLSPRDNVATALRPIEPGEALRIRLGDAVLELRSAEAVPLCHKISLSRIGAGEPVTKYGEPIGLALEAIAPGRHVHVHNMQSARGRAAGGGR
jgi:altronate dehydratase small subunit